MSKQEKNEILLIYHFVCYMSVRKVIISAAGLRTGLCVITIHFVEKNISRFKSEVFCKTKIITILWISLNFLCSCGSNYT